MVQVSNDYQVTEDKPRVLTPIFKLWSLFIVLDAQCPFGANCWFMSFSEVRKGLGIKFQLMETHLMRWVR